MKTIEGNDSSQAPDKLEKQNSNFVHHLAATLYIILRYSFLLFLVVLLAGHEAANSKLGNTTFEFYSVPFRDAIREIQISGKQMNDLSGSFYHGRNYTPAWTVNFDVNDHYRELEEMIAHSYHFGLIPSFFNYSGMREMEKMMHITDDESKKIQFRIEFEETATNAMFQLSRYIAFGIRDHDTTALYKTFVTSLPQYLNQHLKNNSLREGILELQPQNQYYRNLQKALTKYMHVAGRDTFRITTEDIRSNRDLLINRLLVQGFLDKELLNDPSAVHSAIRNFQRAHKLEVSGELNTETLELLSLNARDKFYKIALNLDRIRKEELRSDNYIMVNIPEYELYYYDASGQSRKFRIIVGRKETPTPLLSSQIEMIVTNPQWTVPQSISRNEIIPLLKKDPLYLQKHGFIVVDSRNTLVNVDSLNWNDVKPESFRYWFRQVKTDNALGVVKFLFPNEHAVYIHDTQTKKLFETRQRTYSHGCVRLENPLLFAEMLLSDTQSGKSEGISAMIQNKEQGTIRLKKPVPVFIRYFSCSADASGNIFYYRDVYDMDQAVIQQLFGNNSWN